MSRNVTENEQLILDRCTFASVGAVQAFNQSLTVRQCQFKRLDSSRTGPASITPIELVGRVLFTATILELVEIPNEWLSCETVHDAEGNLHG